LPTLRRKQLGLMANNKIQGLSRSTEECYVAHTLADFLVLLTKKHSHLF
jgi:hypothetical protein